MSHQGHEGWFPECLVCGLGNLDGVVCLRPDDAHPLAPVDAGRVSDLSEADGHWWKRCLLCPADLLADPASWGSVAYCAGCWNDFTRRGERPPTRAGRY